MSFIEIDDKSIEKIINGFSKLSKEQKKKSVIKSFLNNDDSFNEILKSFDHKNEKVQKIFDEFSENTISNFYLPYGVVPNVYINKKMYTVPMVIEESSVVAAASKAAKYWLKRDGFKTEIINTVKNGQVHLYWNGNDSKKLISFFNTNKKHLLKSISKLTENMDKRGGGLIDLSLLDKSSLDQGYFQIWATFNTVDAMGANFINSILEKLGREFEKLVVNKFKENEADIEIVMAILSNYTPDCLVKVSVSCPVNELDGKDEFAFKFKRAVDIARMDKYRATTHNKGIFNGIDAVVLATGNDFRSVEACGHAYASKDGTYRGLSICEIKDDIFNFSMTIPLSIGTVGGITSLHPLAKLSLEMLESPTAKELMSIIASIGLAQNFGALSSLVTTGIQKGHMKMHLINILNVLEATEEEKVLAIKEFKNKVITYKSVDSFIKKNRKYQ